MAKYNFKFGDTWLSEFGAVCTEEPDMEIAQRDVSFIDIPGKDGSDLIDNKRYKNVEFSREIALVGRKVSTANEKAVQLINNFAYLQGYQPFEDTEHNGMVTEAALTNFGEISKKLRTFRTAKLNFTRKPYWYLKESLESKEVTMGTSTTLINPYPATACPTIILMINTSPYSTDTSVNITINVSSTYEGVYSTKNYAIKNAVANYNYPYIVIDIENQCVFSRNDNGEKYKFSDSDVPMPIGPGKTEITISRNGHVKQAWIIPNWRCL